MKDSIARSLVFISVIDLVLSCQRLVKLLNEVFQKLHIGSSNSLKDFFSDLFVDIRKDLLRSIHCCSILNWGLSRNLFEHGAQRSSKKPCQRHALILASIFDLCYLRFLDMQRQILRDSRLTNHQNIHFTSIIFHRLSFWQRYATLRSNLLSSHQTHQLISYRSWRADLLDNSSIFFLCSCLLRFLTPVRNSNFNIMFPWSDSTLLKSICIHYNRWHFSSSVLNRLLKLSLPVFFWAEWFAFRHNQDSIPKLVFDVIEHALIYWKLIIIIKMVIKLTVLPIWSHLNLFIFINNKSVWLLIWSKTAFYPSQERFFLWVFYMFTMSILCNYFSWRLSSLCGYY